MPAPLLTIVYGHGGSSVAVFPPAFDAPWKDAARRRFDIVMAWSVDRLGRSLQDLIAFLPDVHGYGVDLFLHQQGVDTRHQAERPFSR
jgi:DNA invertase Pin-like site-specific DNA recombinase